ncbi:hypothetical protein ABEF95_008069 [Exophiala dermatitidis]
MRSLGKSRVPHLAASLLVKRATAAFPGDLKPRTQHGYYACCSNLASRQKIPRQTSCGWQRSLLNQNTSRTYASTAQSLPRRAPLPRPSQPLPPSNQAARTVTPNGAASPKNNNGPTNSAAAARARASSRPQRSFNIYFWGVSLFGFVLSAYLSSLYVTYQREVKESEQLDLPQNADVSSRWMDLSRNFDDEVDMSEKLMGLRSKRRKLCQQAEGNVLEVSAGTGRNMDLYNLDPINTPRNKRIKSLTFNDQSEIMVYQAEKKFEKLQEETDAIAKFRGPVRFVVGDAADKRVISRPEGGFDTIVQTMGLCSMANPVGFLKRLGELCRQPGEPTKGLDNLTNKKEDGRETDQKPHGEGDSNQDKGGKILLLEHGRSYLGFLNKYLDNIAKRHADRYGCWWNKDIDQIVKDSGLVVESKKRYHFGTTYEYVLRPPPHQTQSTGTTTGPTAAEDVNHA